MCTCGRSSCDAPVHQTINVIIAYVHVARVRARRGENSDDFKTCEVRNDAMMVFAMCECAILSLQIHTNLTDL